MADWRVGQEFEIDGKPATVTRVTWKLEHEVPADGVRFFDQCIENRHTRRPGVAVDWESVERLPDGSPRRLGRMIR